MLRAALSGHSCCVSPTRCIVSNRRTARRRRRAAGRRRCPWRGAKVCCSIQRWTQATVSAKGRGASSKRPCAAQSRVKAVSTADRTLRWRSTTCDGPRGRRSCASRKRMIVPRCAVGGPSAESDASSSATSAAARAARCSSAGDDHSRANRPSSAGSARYRASLSLRSRRAREEDVIGRPAARYENNGERRRAMSAVLAKLESTASKTRSRAAAYGSAARGSASKVCCGTPADEKICRAR